MAEPKVVIEKCPCGRCDKHGLSNGTFWQGNGFTKEVAQRYADLWNTAANIKSTEGN